MNVRPCFWCGGRRDRSMFDQIVEDLTPEVLKIAPCPRCFVDMQKGVTLMEARNVGGVPKPTGFYTVVDVERAKREFLINTDGGVRVAYLDVKTWEARGLPHVRIDRRRQRHPWRAPVEGDKPS